MIQRQVLAAAAEQAKLHAEQGLRAAPRLRPPHLAAAALPREARPRHGDRGRRPPGL